MLNRLGRIKHPAARSAATAATAFTVAALISAGAIGVSHHKGKSPYSFGVFASLVAAGWGGLFGLFVESEANDAKASRKQQETLTSSTGWKDWRNFVIDRKVKESKEITSFYLKPEDRGEIPNFLPGQFLTIKLDIPGQNKPVIRTYSLSDYTASGEYYRLSIKRESAPKDLDVMAGVVSNFMHDRIQAGSVIAAKPPSGKFVLNVQKSSPAVLISNGVGITPMMSMAKACTSQNSNRPIWFIHGARDGKFHAFRDEVLAIARQNPNLHVHFRYSRPNPEDVVQHSIGYVDAALIKEVVAPQLEEMHNSADAEYFLCGSPSFLQSLKAGLKEWGVPEDRVFSESFGPASQTATASAVSENNAGVETEIVFARSGQTLTWHEGDGTILEFAEANGIEPDYSCRQGICLTCMCRLNEGEVAYQIPPTGTPDEGSVLICISQPKTPRVVLDL